MPNRLISRVLRLTIDNFRAFAILGFLPTETGIKPTYLRINIKPYEQTIDKEVKAHSISITNNLEEGKTFDSIVEDHTKERINRVLTNDPGIGVARHADAGYGKAIQIAEKRGIKLP